MLHLQIALCSLSFLVSINSVKSAYENNPFLNKALGQANPNQRDFNQINVALILPEGHLPLSTQGQQPPAPPAPGYVWLQVPTTLNNQNQNQEPLAIPTQKIETENLSKYCLKPRGQFPGSSCNTFVNCWDGSVTEQSCPDGLLFNSRGYCDYPTNVQCLFNKPDGKYEVPSSTKVPLSTTTSKLAYVEVSQEGSTSGLEKYCLKPRGQFSSNACNRYVNCWDGSVIEEECPEGLLFSSKGYCDYPVNVDCSHRSTPKQKEPVPTESTLIPEPTCPLETGTFRQTNNCSFYYSCLNRKIVAVYKCPEGFLFNDNIGVCDYAERVDCSKPPIITKTQNIKTGITSLETPCPFESGTFRQKNNCSNYYTCLGGKIVANYSCPPGFLFNENIGVCDYALKVNCNIEKFINKKADKVYPDLVLEGIDLLKCPKPFGTFRNGLNCAVYYTCVSSKVVAKYQCPQGYHFDHQSGTCEDPSKVNCNNEVITFRKEYIPVIPPDFQDKLDGCIPGKVFRLNPQCTAACLCRDGRAEIIQCPEGFAYDSVTDKCLLPHLARC